MATSLSLNDLFIQYSQGLLDKKQFEGLIFESIISNLRHYNLRSWRRDECMDFLSWIYPRVSRAVGNFKDTGSSFENYINALIRWSAREYRSRSASRYAAEYTVWSSQEPDMYVGGIEPEYSENDDGNASKINDNVDLEKNPRQLLMLILKCYYYVSDDLLDRLAPRLGMKKEALYQMIDMLREQRIKRHDTIRISQERVESQFFRCMIYEKRLKALQEGTAAYERLKVQTEKARRRLGTMRKRLTKTRFEATNLEIAELLGLSKGTVDSTLHNLKLRLNKENNGKPKKKT